MTNCIVNVPIYKYNQIEEIKNDLIKDTELNIPDIDEVVDTIKSIIHETNKYYPEQRDPFEDDGGFVILHLPKHGINNSEFIERMLNDKTEDDCENYNEFKAPHGTTTFVQMDFLANNETVITVIKEK